MSAGPISRPVMARRSLSVNETGAEAGLPLSTPSGQQASEARKTNDQTGPTFRGHRLRRVETGTEGFKAKTGRSLLPARFLSFDYGAVKLREFGTQRSFRFLQGPLGGQIIVFGNYAETTRGRLLVVAEEQSGIAPAETLVMARALRPLPAG